MPLGAFEALRNGRRVEFTIVENDYNTYYVGDVPLRPGGCYVACIGALGMRHGNCAAARYARDCSAVLPCMNGFGELMLDGETKISSMPSWNFRRMLSA